MKKAIAAFFQLLYNHVRHHKGSETLASFDFFTYRHLDMILRGKKAKIRTSQARMNYNKMREKGKGLRFSANS
jgi:hypothetical protein